MMGRRRFAGDKLSSLQAFSPDVLAAATTALKQQQVESKSPSGNRLGPGTQKERDEAAMQTPTSPGTTLTTAATAATTTPTSLSASEIRNLKSALGINQLEAALGLGALGLNMFKQSSTVSAPKFEMPKFEMPKFELPVFKLPSIGGAGASTKQPSAASPTRTAAPASTSQQMTPTSLVQIGAKTYNLAKVGGPGLSGGDIKKMQKKGWTLNEIRQAAAQAPQISTGAQQLLEAKQITGKNQAKTITSRANKAVAKNSTKQTSNKKK